MVWLGQAFLDSGKRFFKICCIACFGLNRLMCRCTRALPDPPFVGVHPLALARADCKFIRYFLGNILGVTWEVAHRMALVVSLAHSLTDSGSPPCLSWTKEHAIKTHYFGKCRMWRGTRAYSHAHPILLLHLQMTPESGCFRSWTLSFFFFLFFFFGLWQNIWNISEGK